jgi:hypothetical protein
MCKPKALVEGGMGRSKGLWVLPLGQDTAEARSDRGAEGYADVKYDPGATGHAENNPAEYGPHKSTYPYAPALSGLHVYAFPLPVYDASVVEQKGRSPARSETPAQKQRYTASSDRSSPCSPL